ncbi:LuxR C-terminal-related transcriptional regulator [Lysinibacillus sp. LZ02]|uniref:LuxR C-terminal-related transcriptional regulator n=1 Tax=Lysinibacillus sp. LZ02 TaxID=3420668 RepID=UPI003D35C524
MTITFHPNEKITFQEFVLFNKTHSKQIERNINIYLNLEPSISESDRKVTEMLLQSFFSLLINSNIEDIDDEASYLNIWFQSQLSNVNQKSFNLFQLVYQKSLIALIIQLKYNYTVPMLLCLLSIFTHLVHSYNNWVDGDDTENTKKNLQENRQLKTLQSIDKLNKILISASGVQDFAYILKKCEEYFNYKRCVFYAYAPWSNQFYGVLGEELLKIQSMKGQLTEEYKVFNREKPIYLKNPKDYVKDEHIKLFNLSSVIFIPITHQDQLFGWVTFDQLGEEFNCSKDELDLLEQVGRRLGLFLSREGTGVVKTSNLQLTEREYVILGLLAEGYDNKKIGALLFLSEHTVREYVSRLMTKLKAKNRTQVVASAFRLGLLN